MTAHRNKIHSGRGKGKLAHKLPGEKVEVKPVAGRRAKTSKVFGLAPKKPEEDDVPGKMRPAAHSAEEGKKAKKRTALMKRLSHQVI
jgi:hypothetical protein